MKYLISLMLVIFIHLLFLAIKTNGGKPHFTKAPEKLKIVLQKTKPPPPKQAKKIGKISNLFQLGHQFKKGNIKDMKKRFDGFNFKNGSLLSGLEKHFVEHLPYRYISGHGMIHLALGPRKIINYRESRIEASSSWLQKNLHKIINKIQHNLSITRRLGQKAYLKIMIRYHQCPNSDRECPTKHFFSSENLVLIDVYNEKPCKASFELPKTLVKDRRL